MPRLPRLRSEPRDWAEWSSPVPGIHTKVVTPELQHPALDALREARRPQDWALQLLVSDQGGLPAPERTVPVSYTHLTLPTICSV
eukprot:394368-Alexandrium_andersonii.AAC.1